MEEREKNKKEGKGEKKEKREIGRGQSRGGS